MEKDFVCLSQFDRDHLDVGHAIHSEAHTLSTPISSAFKGRKNQLLQSCLSPGNGRDQEQLVGIFQGCIQTLQVDQVLFVQIQVNKGSQVAMFVDELRAQGRVLVEQAFQGFTGGTARECHDLFTVHIVTHRVRDADAWHVRILRLFEPYG
jgi:hypothetical protein